MNRIEKTCPKEYNNLVNSFDVLFNGKYTLEDYASDSWEFTTIIPEMKARVFDKKYMN